MKLEDIINAFTNQLRAFIETDLRTRLESALGVRRGPGRPPGSGKVLALGIPRRRGPKQLCPVPGCKNPAAPIFGMVCGQHKDVPKAQIKKYREARRTGKTGKPVTSVKAAPNTAVAAKKTAAAKKPVTSKKKAK